MTLSEISRAHQNSCEVATKGVTVYDCSHNDPDVVRIRAFDRARHELQKAVNALQSDEALKTFTSICAQINARICRTPCSPAWVVENDFRARIQELQPKVAPAVGSADRSIQSKFKAVCERLAELKQIRTNPLATEVRAMLELYESDSNREIVVVIRQPTLWQEARRALDPEGKRNRMTIMKPSQLRWSSPVDRLILFGPPWLFGFKDELFLFRSPVAGNLDVFAFDHDCGGQISMSAVEVVPIQFNGLEARPPEAENFQEEPLSMFKPRAFIHRAFAEPESDDETADTQLVDAWQVHLGGNKGTYLDPEGSVFTLECSQNGGGMVCSEVARKDVEELETGDLIVLTTEGGGDLIRPLADELLGDRAKIFRDCQDSWKKKLRGVFAEVGTSALVEKLLALGSRRANVQNLRNWMGARNIGPTDLNTDFRAILALCGLEEELERYCEAIDEIRGAHQSAGIQLQDRLQARLKSMDVTQTFVNGFLEVRTEKNGSEIGGPAKTIFLVENINRQAVNVGAHNLNRIFKLEEPNS